MQEVLLDEADSAIITGKFRGENGTVVVMTTSIVKPAPLAGSFTTA